MLYNIFDIFLNEKSQYGKLVHEFCFTLNTTYPTVRVIFNFLKVKDQIHEADPKLSKCKQTALITTSVLHCSDIHNYTSSPHVTRPFK
jgi:hypothetical protein